VLVGEKKVPLAPFCRLGLADGSRFEVGLPTARPVVDDTEERDEAGESDVLVAHETRYSPWRIGPAILIMVRWIPCRYITFETHFAYP